MEESIAEYISELRQFARNYGIILQDMIRDRLSYGLKHEHIQQCLHSEGDASTLEKVIDIVQPIDVVQHILNNCR